MFTAAVVLPAPPFCEATAHTTFPFALLLPIRLLSDWLGHFLA